MDYLPLLIALLLGTGLGFLVASLRGREGLRDLGALQATLDASQRDSQRLQVDIDRLRESETELRSKLNSSEQACSAAQVSCKGAESKVESLVEQVGELVRKIDSAEAELIPLRASRTQLDTEKRLLEESKADQAKFLQEAQTALREAFESLAGKTLESTNTQFLQQAEAQFKAMQETGATELAGRQRSIEEILIPVKETLKQLDEKTQRLENERSQKLGNLDGQLTRLAESHLTLSKETRKLTDALKSAKARGMWGEVALQRLLELAGLTLHVDFKNQQSHADDDGKVLRPDCIITLPGERSLVIDAKVPFTCYYEAHEAETEEARAAALQRHAAAVQTHVRALSNKAYQKQIAGALDFVVMFVPNDTFLAAAVEARPELLEDALQKRVLLLTPASLLALLHAVARGWELRDVQENAEEIRKLGEELCRRLLTFMSHLQGVGKGLDSAQDHYRRAVGSLESRVLVSARRFENLGIKPKAPLTLALEGDFIASPEEQLALLPEALLIDADDSLNGEPSAHEVAAPEPAGSTISQ